VLKRVHYPFLDNAAQESVGAILSPVFSSDVDILCLPRRSSNDPVDRARARELE